MVGVAPLHQKKPAVSPQGSRCFQKADQTDHPAMRHLCSGYTAVITSPTCEGQQLQPWSCWPSEEPGQCWPDGYLSDRAAWHAAA